MVAPAAKRKAVAHLVQAHGVSERRACSLVGADRTMIRYRSRRPDDADLRERLRDLGGARRRFGYRRLHVLLRQEGWTVNRKKTRHASLRYPVLILSLACIGSKHCSLVPAKAREASVVVLHIGRA